MKIAVASGKGGTGKTTVAINLALALSEKAKVRILDCDVEEPNCNIFLNFQMKKREEVTSTLAQIDRNLCKLCGKCAEFCQFHAISLLPNGATVLPSLCHGCGGCILVCPEHAISEKKRTIGEIYQGGIGDIELVAGELVVGARTAVPVLRKLKKFLDMYKINILDAPPGCGCSLVETLRGCDYCLLVTEPTPFGLYDLKLAVSIVRKLGLPCGVVINKAVSEQNHLIENYCNSENIEILAYIPLQMKIAALYSKGVPFISQMENWRDRFLSIFSKIEADVNEANRSGKW